MSLHRLYLDTPEDLRPGEIIVGGEEAHHAVRVKRVEMGERVEILDGRGRIGHGAVAATEKARGGGWCVRVAVERITTAPRVAPRIEVLSPAPKGSRLTDLVDGLSQVGAASWSLLEAQRSAGEPREGKMDRLHRAAAEASKQCGRAWLLEIGPGVRFSDAIAPAADRISILADASGEPFRHHGGGGVGAVRLLIGPEGGWAPAELTQARAAGVQVARFGPHIMRVETAAVAAAAIVFAAEAAERP